MGGGTCIECDLCVIWTMSNKGYSIFRLITPLLLGAVLLVLEYEVTVKPPEQGKTKNCLFVCLSVCVCVCVRVYVCAYM